MVDLASPEQKPGFAADGLLRAMRVLGAQTGLEWESRAHLAALGFDFTGVVAMPAVPEACIADQSNTPAVGEFSAWEVVAGARGAWVWFRTTIANRYVRADSLEVATATTARTPINYAWSVNGGVLTQVNDVRTAAAEVGYQWGTTAGTVQSVFAPYFGNIWLPPGGVARWAATVANVGLLSSILVREPLAGP